MKFNNLQTALANLGLSGTDFAKMKRLAKTEVAAGDVIETSRLDLQEAIEEQNRQSVFVPAEDENEYDMEAVSPMMRKAFA